MRYKLFLMISVLCLMFVAPAHIQAQEWFVDLYLGAAITDNSDVTVEDYFPRESASEKTSFDTSFTFGGRFGYWLDLSEHLDLGFALDVSYFQADSENVDFSIVPWSVLLMLRFPLMISDDYPQGRIQPYLAGGPSLIYYDLSVDLRPAVSETISSWSFGGGLDFRVGLLWQFHRNLGIFGEYRYTRYEIDYEEETAEWIFGFQPRTKLAVDTTLNTHHFLTGVSFRF